MAVKAEGDGQGGITQTEMERLMTFSRLLQESGANMISSEYAGGVWKVRVKMKDGEEREFTLKDDEGAAAFLGGIQG